MKRIILILLFLNIIFIAGCDFDPFKGKRPVDYENSIWLSKDPYLYLEYGENGEEKSGLFLEGQIQMDISFLYSALDNGVSILNKDKVIINCKAKFNNKYCILTITDVFIDLPIEIKQITINRIK